MLSDRFPYGVVQIQLPYVLSPLACPTMTEGSCPSRTHGADDFGLQAATTTIPVVFLVGEWRFKMKLLAPDGAMAVGCRLGQPFVIESQEAQCPSHSPSARPRGTTKSGKPCRPPATKKERQPCRSPAKLRRLCAIRRVRVL